ncbi:MAG: ABC transporter permease [Clostridiales bacterium]|nr:ABC transporter permease [Clostridiales bacterium]
MGLYFVGAIVLYEKGERVLDSLAVSPVRPWEYVVSKLISIALISVLVGLAIGISAGIILNPLLFIVAVFLLSCVYSAAGLIIASKIETLDQFILVTIPAEIMMNVPAVFWILDVRNGWLMIHPGICMINLSTDVGLWLFPLLILILWTVLLFCLACHSVTKMLKTLGG